MNVRLYKCYLYFSYSLIFSVVAISGCSFNRDNFDTGIETEKKFTYSGNVNAPDKWWNSFNDNALDTLVEIALDSNFNLQSAFHRYMAAQELSRRESSSLFPEISANANIRTVQPGRRNLPGEDMTAGLSADYEVDLWGRLNSIADAAGYRAEATYLDYQAASISISAEIATTWFRLIEASKQIELLNEQIETNEKMLSLIRNRFGTGQIRSVDILRQRQLLESTQEQLSYIKSNKSVLENSINILTGKLPQSIINLSYDELPDMPELPNTGIPSELINRRPDVIAAFKRLQAADEDLAAAISNRFPRISFSVSLETEAQKVGDLFDKWIYTFVGNLLAPIFYGGRLSAEVDRNEHLKMQALNDYGQTILNAVGEVENALALENNQKESINYIESQLLLAQQSNEQLRIEYLNGMSDYLDVLSGLIEEQRLKRDLLTAQRLLMEYRVSLYRALAGSIINYEEYQEVN